MEALTADRLSAQHAEAYRSLIKGFCALENINQDDFAGLIGISRVHLNYVLNGHREPGAKFERGVEQSKRLPQDFKESLLSTIWTARYYESASEVQFYYEVKHRSPGEILASLDTEYTMVTFGNPSELEARHIYYKIHTRCRRLTSHPERVKGDPLAFAQLCTMQTDVAGILGLDKVYASLQTGLMAEALMDSLSRSDFSGRRETFDHIRVNATRVPGLVRQNLHLYRSAFRQFEKAETDEFVRQRPDIWLPHMARDKLKVLACLPRFSLRDAEELAARGRDACYNEVLYLLVDLALARCYINYGSERSLGRCKQILDRSLDNVQHQRIGKLTPLHRVIAYRMHAALDLKRHEEYANYEKRVDTLLFDSVRRALRIASQAGMWNQVRKIRSAYAVTAQELERRGYVRLGKS